ncbi:MAG: efflux RND transporter periplasmic adaptor subunit [Verrucomicrobiota bacterium]|nr:efflux RND transporter periplasmic adaptor subunit [Verrucomicrobiota bacterium]
MKPLSSLRLCGDFFLIALLLFSGCSSEQGPLPPPSYPVKLTTVQQKEVPIFIEALGHVESMISIHIKSRVEGELTGVYFQQGQEVKQGDLLFTIDSKPYEAALKKSQGVLEQTLANLSIAEEKVKRYETLAREEYYSQIDFETLQANFASALAQANQAQAQVDAAAIDLDYCWIYAPIDGVVGILQVDFGNLVGNDENQPLVTLNQISPIFVTFSVPEINLPDIQKYRRQGSLKTLAAYDNFNDEPFVGKLEILDNQVDPGTGMIKLRALFPNTTRDLWPGQFIRTRLVLHTQSNALVIPYTAVQLTINGPVAFVVKEDMTVEERPLQLGARQDDQVIVQSGLNAGETIVLEGQLNLSTGTRVFVARNR